MGIAGIVLGATGLQRTTIPGQGLRVDRIEDEEGILEQGMDQGHLARFDADGDLAVGKTVPELMSPVLDGLGLVGKHTVFQVIGAGDPQAQVMFLVGPVDADDGRIVVEGIHGEASCCYSWKRIGMLISAKAL